MKIYKVPALQKSHHCFLFLASATQPLSYPTVSSKNEALHQALITPQAFSNRLLYSSRLVGSNVLILSGVATTESEGLTHLYVDKLNGLVVLIASIFGTLLNVNQVGLVYVSCLTQVVFNELQMFLALDFLIYDLGLDAISFLNMTSITSLSSLQSLAVSLPLSCFAG